MMAVASFTEAQHRTRVGCVTLALALLLAATPGATSAADAAEAVDSGPSGDAPSASPAEERRCWQDIELPETLGAGRINELVVAEDAVWVLGLPSHDDRDRPLALLRDGDEWTDTDLPWREGSGLVGGDAEPGGDTWAVGFTRPPEAPGTLDLDVSASPIAGRWLGDRWEDVPVPDPSRSATALVDVEVLPSGIAHAVGTRLESGRTRPLALRWDGRWRPDDPRIGAPEAGLTAVTSSPDGIIWATGWILEGGDPRPLLLRRAGGSWQRTPGAWTPEGSAVLTDIEFRAADDGYAVGYQTPATDTRFVPLVLHWDGQAWTRLELPWAPDASAVLRSVTVGEGDSLLLTGARTASNAGWTRAFHARYGGGHWEVRRADVGAYRNSELADGLLEAGRPTVAGGRAGRAMLLEGCEKLGPSDKPRDRDSAAEDEVAVPGEAPVPAGSPAPAEAGGDPGAAPEVLPSGGRVRPRFEDVAVGAGLYEVTDSWGAVTADFDGDGWSDIFYSRHNEREPRLLLGGPTGFRDVVDAPFRDRDRHGCAAADVDADGWVDLFCTHGRVLGSAMASHELWLRPGVAPEQRTVDFGLVDPFGRGRAATFLDLDGDPFPDLYVTNEPERTDGLPSLSRLYRNDGGTRYLPYPRPATDTSMGGRCVTAADLDGDGDDELLVCATEPWRGRPAGLRVFRNEGGTLREATASMGLDPIGDVDVAVADLDGDGRADDIAQLGASSLRVSLRGHHGFARSFEMPLSHGVALATGDADGDGLADLYVVRSGRVNLADLMLLGGGHGRRFRDVPIPQATTGAGDDVVAIDHDRNGLSDFLVLNGRGSPGPVQLIAAYPDA